MLYEEQKKKAVKIGKKNYTWNAKPGVVSLADALWNKMYPFLEGVDEQMKYDVLIEQLIIIAAYNSKVIPDKDLPVQNLPREIIDNKPEVQKEPILRDHPESFDGLEVQEALNDLFDDKLEEVTANRAVQLLR